MSLTIRLMNFLSKRSRASIWVMAVSLVLLLGVIDYVTGTRISITFFYLLPVALASWSLGVRAGRLVGVLSTLAAQSGAFVADGGEGIALTFWNLTVRLGVFLVVAHLVSEFRRLLTHQTELSRTDSLTGSLNRRAFLEAGEVALEKMQRFESPLTLAFLDVDNFKAVNDAAGHSAGDALLVGVADCLRAQLWGTDTVARLGGDEFGVLLPHTGPTAAQKVFPRLVQQLGRAMELAGWPVTFSIGVITCTTRPPDMEQILRQADRLMYAAKRAGKNRVEYAVYSSADEPAARPEDAGPSCDRVPEVQ